MTIESSPADAGLFSAEQLDAYRRDGYLVRENLLSATEVETLRGASLQVDASATALAQHGKTYFLDGNRFVDVGIRTLQFEHSEGSQALRVVEPVHDLASAFEALVDDPRLVGPMQQIIGAAPLSLWTSKLNFKPAGIGSGFGWHQDSPYWIHDSEDVDRLPNVLVAFDEARVDNGALQVVRGSHTQGCLPGRADGSQLEGFYTHDDYIDPEACVTLCMPAGSAVFFDPHLIHGSGPNHSEDERRAIILTYQPGGGVLLKSKEARLVRN
ncbi:MAG: phytanoyl-CoA dioxygenase family protein [Pseudomonadaceae bacterium]|nr:phytanoyl-CoA dioxygenase family protein [Pseudomonadaceae bacterium]